MLFTWRARTAELLGEWERSTRLWSVATLDETKIIASDCDGNVTVHTHNLASSFQVHCVLKNSHSNLVTEITVHDDIVVTCSEEKEAKVWDKDSLTLLKTLPHDGWVRSSAVSCKHIVITSGGPKKKICVYQNANDYKLLFELPPPTSNIGFIAFLDDDIVACPSGPHVYFVSIPRKSILTRVPTENIVRSFAVLSDAQIAWGGKDGYCAIITPPKSVQSVVEDCAASLRSPSSIASTHVPPLRAAWLAVGEHRLTLAEACKTVITSENCSTSLDEWCIAHNLLVNAVKSKEVPPSRHFDDSIAHWHTVLYQHCAKLAMGKKCIDFVKSIFKEAEDAGVIATGQIESLINTIAIRRDMDSDNRFLVHAIYQLFLRQAEAELRLREVLHYQRVQQVTALVNAVVGCIPVGGAILTNVFSGGASILNDMQVCGFVESLLGIGKGLSSDFGSELLVNRFLQRANSAMTVDEWKKIPEEKRKVVEDAASNVGLTVDELREKLLLVAKLKAREGCSTYEQVGIEEIDGNMQQIDGDAISEAVVYAEYVSQDVESVPTESSYVGAAVASAQNLRLSGASRELVNELELWKAKGVRKEAVESLGSEEAAACVAAYLVKYEAKLCVIFSKYKDVLAKQFAMTCTFGETFTDESEGYRDKVLDVVISALVEVTERKMLGPAR